MAKQQKSIISGFLSDVKTPQDEVVSEKSLKKQKKVRYKRCRYKGFYIDPENELKLKELQMHFLKENQKLDESEIINQAILHYYSFILKN